MIQEDVSKFLPPGFKEPAEDQSLSLNKIFPSIKPDETSKGIPHSLLPADYPKSLLTSTSRPAQPTRLPSGYKIKQEEVDPSFLPPGYKIKEEKLDSSFLPPGYKIKEEKIDPALLPPGFNVEQEDIDPSLLPAGYSPEKIKIKPAALDPSLLPKDYNPAVAAAEPVELSTASPPPRSKKTKAPIKLVFPG